MFRERVRTCVRVHTRAICTRVLWLDDAAPRRVAPPHALREIVSLLLVTEAACAEDARLCCERVKQLLYVPRERVITPFVPLTAR